MSRRLADARRADAVDRRRRPARPLEGHRGAGHLQRALALAAGRRVSTICASGPINTGAWRDNGDGYVEKGPFPPAKTSVKAVTRTRDDATGKATIDLTAVNGGDKVRNPLLADRRRLGIVPAGSRRHLRERRDGPVVPGGRSGRQA